MSRIAKNSIKMPEGTSCALDNNILTVKGKNGEITLKFNEKYTIKNEKNEIFVLPLEANGKSDPIWGTIRANVANLITGVNSGFSKTLILNGTGYKASIAGSKLKLQLGYSHDIEYEIPKNVKIECPKANIIKISSVNKELLGIVAAKIRFFQNSAANTLLKWKISSSCTSSAILAPILGNRFGRIGI